MGRNLNHLWIHCSWSVKYRNPVINDEMMKEIRQFIKDHFCDRSYKVVCSNGYRDHLHVMIKPGLTDPISKIVKDIKGATSYWINSKGIIRGKFAWQRGFSAFSVSPKDVARIIKYIENQQEHHKYRSPPD